MRLAIRADGGPELGYGHLIRTGALAHRSLQAGDQVLYFTRTPDAVNEVLPEEIIPVTLTDKNEVNEVIQYINKYVVDVLFTDSFTVDTEYQKQLSDTDATIAVRHNYQHYTVCCDVLVYGDLHAPDLEYDWVGSRPRFCLGPDYILLREQFRRAARSKSRWREPPTRGLVVMGGSDVNNTTPVAMRVLDKHNLDVDIVIGPGFSNVREIERTVKELDTNFKLLYNPENMSDIMERADLAISAVGGAVFELLATRTPFVGIPQAENQNQRAKVLQRRDLSIIKDDETRLEGGVNELLSGDRRRELFENMAGIVDAQGPKRVHKYIT